MASRLSAHPRRAPRTPHADSRNNPGGWQQSRAARRDRSDCAAAGSGMGPNHEQGKASGKPARRSDYGSDGCGDRRTDHQTENESERINRQDRDHEPDPGCHDRARCCARFGSVTH